jgi:outer membrane protein
MRHSIYLTYLVFFLFAVLPVTGFAQTIAVADADVIMNKSKAGMSIKDQLKDKKDAYQKEFEKMQSDLRDQEGELLKKRGSIPPEEFQTKAQEFREMLAKEDSAFQKKRSELDAATQNALQELQVKIGESIQAVAKEKELDFVFPKQGLLYASAGQIDITKDVVEKLDNEVKRIDVKVGK